MTERRQVERFAELLDEATGGRRHHRRLDIDTDLAPLVTTTQRVGTLPRPEASEEFRDGLRAMLMAAIEREGIGATAAVKAELAAARTAMNAKTQLIRQVTTPGPGRTRAAIIAGVAAGALALSGVSLASTDSVPGDALYSVKRSSEQAQLVLAGSDANRGRLHLEFAKSRLLEAGQVDGDDVLAALATMDDEVLAGARMLFITALQNGDESAIDAVLAFVRQQRADLSRLQADLPQAEAVLRGSLDLLGEVESRANQLGAALVDKCPATTFDRLGPSPSCTPAH
jgi:Domain of unknown function (DUF5667)